MYEFPFETTRAVTSLIYWARSIETRYSLAAGARGWRRTLPRAPARLARRAAAGRRVRAPGKAVPRATCRSSSMTPGYRTTIPRWPPLAVAPLAQVVFGTDWPYCALPPRRSVPGACRARPRGARDGRRRKRGCADPTPLLRSGRRRGVVGRRGLTSRTVYSVLSATRPGRRSFTLGGHPPSAGRKRWDRPKAPLHPDGPVARRRSRARA